MNEKLSITLPGDLVAIVRAQVDSGHYGSISDAVRDALEQHAWFDDMNGPSMEIMRERVRASLAIPRPLSHPTRCAPG